MKAVVIDRPGAVRVDSVPDPEIGPKDVLIRVRACGICGTDLHILDGEFPPTVYPIIPGHEFGGEVVEVGSAVTVVKAGDRVGVDPTLNCGVCYFCQRGMANLCDRWNGVGVVNHPGGFAELVAVPERCVYPIPDSMTFAEAALIEPIACVVRGFDRLQPRIGDTYLVYGAGPIGLLNAQLARFHGASLVAIIDINEGRLARARDEFGFAHVATSLDQLRPLAPRGFDNVIEATGKTKVAEQAIDAVIRRGKLLIFGVCPPGEKAAYDAFKIYNEEITILGTMAILDSYGPAVAISAAGAVNGPKLVTHTFPLDDFEAAVEVARRGQGLKVQVAPNG